METGVSGRAKMILLVINCIISAIGNCGGPMLMRLYFIHGGKRVWLSSWLETGGWPVILIPLAVAYHQRRRKEGSTRLFLMGLPLFLGSAAIGILTGLDDYFYAYGVARLPVSTSSLILASQLAFTAGFAFLLVKQRFTPFSINAIVLLTFGGVVLALHTSGDRPEGETSRQYVLGFAMTVAAAVLYGLILPLVELSYMKSRQEITYTLVLEVNLVLCFFATAFCTVGMLINNDFQAIRKEGREYELGEVKYYVVLVLNGIVWQGFFLGAVGIIFCASSLLSGIVIAVLLPITEVLAVIFFQEKFQAEKGLSLALSLWGFVSYFYGEIKHSKNTQPKNQTPEAEMRQIHVTQHHTV